MREIKWQKPSPGSWELDASHQAHPYGRYMDDVLLAPYEQGFAEGFAEAGIPLRTIEGAIVNGWWYMCTRALGGPAEPKGPPPAFVMWLMFKLHPELRRRRRRAGVFFAERRWESMIAAWSDEERPRFVTRLEALGALEPKALDDAALATALRDASRLLRDLNLCHYRGVAAVAVPFGDFLVHTERWAVVDAKQAIPAVAGYTSATSKPLEALDDVIEALREADALRLLDEDDAVVEIERLGGEPAARLAEFRRVYGARVMTDYSVFGRTLDELPHVLRDNLRQRSASDTGPRQARARADARAAELRKKIPAEHREAWDDMLDAARACSERREDEGGLIHHSTGIARKLLLEIGARLVERGSMDEAESAFDLTQPESLALLKGSGPSIDEVRTFTAERRRNAQLEPPTWIGPRAEPPPVEVFPEEMRRLVSTVFAFVSRISPDADPITEEGLAGHGVSPGTVTGRASVVRSLKDFERFARGDILVAQMTTPSFNTLLAAASGLVTETGGLVCHAAIVARELGIPGVVGVDGVLDAVPHGALLRVDGDRGTIEVLAEQTASAPAEPIAAERESDVPSATMPSEPGLIAALDAAGDTEAFGGKAASLAKLVEQGVPVPWGVALDVNATQAMAAGDAEHGARLREALADRAGPFAVRSSATVEDSGAASFAGQFKTVLGAGSPEEVLDAIVEVWRSGKSESVRAYQQRLGRDTRVSMAVVIQELLPASSAGVLFFDPSHPIHVIEAAWGIGATVVDGSVTPDRYEIDGRGRLERLTVGDKRVELLESGAGLARRDVDPERAVARCLDDAQLVALAQLGARVCEVFGDARDIEWAFVGNDSYCLQARPITRALG